RRAPRKRAPRPRAPPRGPACGNGKEAKTNDRTATIRRRTTGATMRMPGGDAALVDLKKLTGYCLNPEHPRGKHKARVFATLGFTFENASELRAALLIAATSGDAQPAASDQFGDRYVLEFEIEGPRGKGIVRSTWIVRRGESAPRL